MTIPDGLAGQVFLLAYDTEKQRLTVRPWLGYLLRAAALADLRGRRIVDDQDRRVRVQAVPPAVQPGALAAASGDRRGPPAHLGRMDPARSPRHRGRGDPGSGRPPASSSWTGPAGCGRGRGSTSPIHGC